MIDLNMDDLVPSDLVFSRLTENLTGEFRYEGILFIRWMEVGATEEEWEKLADFFLVGSRGLRDKAKDSVGHFPFLSPAGETQAKDR